MCKLTLSFIIILASGSFVGTRLHSVLNNKHAERKVHTPGLGLLYVMNGNCCVFSLLALLNAADEIRDRSNTRL